MNAATVGAQVGPTPARATRAALAFDLPAALEAREPPEARGLARDAVRLMATSRADGVIAHSRFADLPGLLTPGDLLVVNDSATLPAAIAARREDGSAVELRISTAAPGMPEGWWIVELRSADGTAPLLTHRAPRAPAGGGGAQPGPTPRKRERLTLAGGARVELIAPYRRSPRLWRARIESDAPLFDHLARHGHPIRYDYVDDAWPLDAYQTAFATTPGSAEMPSAARPFTPELVARLIARGVLVAPITLHTGVSSPERHEPPYPERYAVPVTTARLVDAAGDWGGRVIAVGTTVVRALESVVGEDGTVAAGDGWTDLVITPERGVRTVDGLITGWHEPQASHLQMLAAIAGEPLLEASYAAALDHGYLWHEFGDSHLILP